MTKKVLLSLAAVGMMSQPLMAGGDIAPVVIPNIDIPSTVMADYVVGLKVGTLGVGIDLSMPIADKVNVRFNVNGFTYSDTREEDGVDYDATLDLLTAGVLIDYFPIDESRFRVSAGAYYNGNELTGSAVASAGNTVTIDNNTYNLSDIGSLDLDVTFDDFAPYVGLGWGSSVTKSGWSFTIDVGVMYQNNPIIELTHGNCILDDIGSPLSCAQLQTDIDTEVTNLKADYLKDEYKFYPVVMLGATYAF